MKQLRLSSTLSLPVDAATQTFLNVGKRGSGKSTTAARLVEQLLKAKVPVVVLDPVDTWYGLKASSDGKGPGHDVYVFGGRHADLPLEAHGGGLIADVLCEHRVPMVLSCKHLSGAARSQFMIDFATTLFQKWPGDGVLHLVLEEAHELAPQAPPKGEKAEIMLGAFKRLWKLGRSSGIGGTAITQRPASLSKDITTQSEILIVHRTIGPQDVEAVRQWIKYRQQPEAILAELATLKTGEAFVWAPEFPEGDPIGLKRVQILPRETFDSSATPKHGEQRAEPKELAAVDLERLRTKMAATIQRAKAEDPRELKRRIAELERELKAKPAAAPATEAKPPRVIERKIVTDAQVGSFARATASLDNLVEKHAARMAAGQAEIEASLERARELGNQIKAALAAARDEQARVSQRSVGAGRPGGLQIPARTGAAGDPSRPAPVVRPRANGKADGDLPKTERTLLIAIAQNALGASREQLSVLTGYKRSTRDRYVLYLVQRGYVGVDGDRILATDAGIEALGDSYEPLPTGDALREHWLEKLPMTERRLFEVIVGAYPKAVDREALSEATGYKRSTRDRYVLYLKARKLVDDAGRGELRASDQLFEGRA